jgi:hypothetical protein
MTGHIYRDGSVSLVLRVHELSRDVQEREARLDPALHALLPEELATQLAQLRAAIAPPVGTPGELTRRALALVGYRDLLDLAVREGMARAHAARLPEGAPELEYAALGGLPFLDLSKLQPHADDLQRSFEGALSAFGAVTFGMEDGACHSRFTWHGSPFSALAAYAQSSEGVLMTRVAFATRVVPDAPRLHVRGRTPADGATRDESGNGADSASRFEVLFVVDAEPKARALLTPDVRRWLVSIARRDAPTLWVEDGEARVTWSWDPDAAMFDAAVRSLHAIRKTPMPRGGR